MSKKSINFKILPPYEKTVSFYEKLSMPFERGYFFGLETQLTILETLRLRNGTIWIKTRENREIDGSR